MGFKKSYLAQLLVRWQHEVFQINKIELAFQSPQYLPVLLMQLP